MSHTVSSKMQPGVMVTLSDAEYELWLELGIVYEGAPIPVTTSYLDAQVAELVDRVESATRAELRALMGSDAGGLNDGVVSTLVTGPSTTATTLRGAYGRPVVTVSASDSPNPGRADFLCTGTGDEVTVQAAINSLPASGGRVLLRAGTYSFSGSVTLPPTVGIVGEGTPATTIRYNGAAGGRVLTTAAFTSTAQAAWTGGLLDFRIVYPAAKITSTTKVVYLAQPFAPVDITIVNESVSTTMVAGSYGLVLDGCSNPGTMRVDANVQANFQAAVKASANHLAIFGQGSYCGTFLEVDADSIASSAGPPYNVNVYGFHAYQVSVAALHVIRATSVHVWGGLNESPGGVAPDMLCESTFTAEASLREVKNIGSARLVHYGSGTVHVESTQYQERHRYTGQVSGAPVDMAGWNPLTLQNSWVDYGAPFIGAQYRKTLDGEVELRGHIKSGTTTAGTVLAQVNTANYRPAGMLTYLIDSNGASGEIRVDVDGSVILMAGSATQMDLTGIHWTASH